MSTNLLLVFATLFILMALALGFVCGRLYEGNHRPKGDKDEQLAPSTPYRRTRPTVPKYNFANQLDPIVPEPTLRTLDELKDVEKTEVEDE